jgi:hypothetical protein
LGLKERIFFYFEGFQREKEGHDTRIIYYIIMRKNEESISTSDFLLENHPSSKKNHPIWSTESEDIVDLKSIVLGFSYDDHMDLQHKYILIGCSDSNNTNTIE